MNGEAPVRAPLPDPVKVALDEFRKTIMMVTHDAKAAERAKTVLHLEKGVLLERGAAVKAEGGLTTTAEREVVR